MCKKQVEAELALKAPARLPLCHSWHSPLDKEPALDVLGVRARQLLVSGPSFLTDKLRGPDLVAACATVLRGLGMSGGRVTAGSRRHRWRSANSAESRATDLWLELVAYRAWLSHEVVSSPSCRVCSRPGGPPETLLGSLQKGCFLLQQRGPHVCGFKASECLCPPPRPRHEVRLWFN